MTSSLRRLVVALTVLLPVMSAQAQGLSVEDFLATARIEGLAVSPDGRTVAAVVERDDLGSDQAVRHLWLLGLADDGQPLTPERVSARPAPYANLSWSPDGSALVYTAPPEAGGGPQVLALDVQSRTERQLSAGTPVVLGYRWGPDGRIWFTGPSPPSDPAASARFGAVRRYVSDAPSPGTRFYRTAPWPDVADAALVAETPLGVFSFDVAPDGDAVAFSAGALVHTPPRAGLGAVEVYVAPVGGAPHRITDNATPELPVRWAPDGRTVYVRTVGPTDGPWWRWWNGRLLALDTETGAFREVAPDLPGEVMPDFAPPVVLDDGRVLVEVLASTSNNVYLVDPEQGRGTPVTTTAGKVSDVTVGGGAVAYVATTPERYAEVYLAPGLSRMDEAVRISSFNDELSRLPHGVVETIRWQNSDGDTVEGVLHWPPGRYREAGLPLVVNIHGGPHVALRAERALNGGFLFMSYPALLTSRGYLVLEPNYRGSTGRDDAFLQAISGHGCTRPADDVLTGVDYVLAQRWADADRLGVVGYSYGGIVANCLVGMTDRFAAIVSGAGVYNQLSAFGHISAGGISLPAHVAGGALPWEDPDAYLDESAIAFVASARTPTLLVAGDEDAVISPAESLDFYRALTLLGVPAELLVFPGEGHGFQRPSHKVLKVTRELEWLDQYLRAD